jgi:hypothetical protein
MYTVQNTNGVILRGLFEEIETYNEAEKQLKVMEKKGFGKNLVVVEVGEEK